MCIVYVRERPILNTINNILITNSEIVFNWCNWPKSPRPISALITMLFYFPTISPVGCFLPDLRYLWLNYLVLPGLFLLPITWSFLRSSVFVINQLGVLGRHLFGLTLVAYIYRVVPLFRSFFGKPLARNPPINRQHRVSESITSIEGL